MRWYQIQFYYLPKWKLPNHCHANVAAQMCSHSVFHSLWIVVENGAKKCAMLISPHFLFLFFYFQLLSPSSPCHCTARTHQTKHRTSKKCLLKLCLPTRRCAIFKMCDVRRCGAHTQTYLTSRSWTKTFLKLVKYLWFWSHWRMKKKKLREKKVKKARYKKVERSLKSISFTAKCAERKFRKKKIRKRVRKLKIAQCAKTYFKKLMKQP